MSEERLDANDKVMEAHDGYVNLPASLGEASPLQSSGDYVRSGISRNYELLTVLYRENWIAKRIIDMPCEDATREWYTLSTELNQNLIDKIKKIEAKHNVKGEITNAMRWARLYGGSLALIVIKGQEDMLDEPLDYDMIMPGSFKGLLVLDMVTGITPSIELEEDMDDPDFGLPKWYYVVIDSYDGEMVRIHHSRVLRFIGRDLPPEEEILENYWGASELEHIYEELQKRNATSANIAQLVFQANTRVLKMADYGEVIGMGTTKQKKEVLAAIEAQNRLLTSFGVQIMGTEDNMESHPYSFSGISEVYESFMMDMAGAANIPATKLFGRSPQGMNATGESDMNNYYESIAQMQERTLKPALEKLLPVICMSIFGAIPNDMEIVFEPIATTTPEQRSNIAGQFTGTIIEAFSAGLIGRKTALMELKEMGKDIGVWTKISDETIEEADDEVDSGEMGGMPPDGGDMPMMPPEGQEMPEQQEEPAESSGGKIVQMPRKEPSDEEIVNEVLEEGQDGGPGSGNFNHPGYRRGTGKAGIKERIGFMANPTANIPEPKRQERTRENVEKANQERKDWSNLTTHQKIQGNAEQERHMRQVKGEVYKAAAKGDLEKAKSIVRQNKHYFMNDPESAMKVQSETLKRQKKAKSGFIQDFFRKVFKKSEDGGEGSGNFNHAGRPGSVGGSAPTKGGSGGSSGTRETEYTKELKILREKSPSWSPNRKAYSLYKHGVLDQDTALQAAKDGTIDKYFNKYIECLERNGDPTPEKPLRKEVNLYQEVEQEGKHGGDYIQARKDYIKDWTGCDDAEAEKTLKQFDTWFGGGWYNADTNTLDGYIDKDGAYDGEIYRGMSFDEDGYRQFMEGMEPGAKFGMRGYNSSWTTSKEMAHAFSRTGERNVVIHCVNNRTSAPVSHLSTKGEEEVLAHSKAQWTVLGVIEGRNRTEITVMEAADRMSDSEKESRRKSERGGVVHDSVPDGDMMKRMNEQSKYFHVVSRMAKDENPNHDPETGRFTTGSGASSSSEESKSKEIESLKSQISKLSRFGEAGKKRAELTKKLSDLTGESGNKGESKPKAEKPKVEKANTVPERNLPVTKQKESQFDIIQKSNPMHDDIHTGIRKASDIMSPEEAFNDSDENAYVYPDFTREDGKKALETGVVTVYSSYPIEDGVFVSPSKKMATDYAGNGKVYSKEIPVEEVAWINAGEGQYARVNKQPNKVEIRDAASKVVSSGYKKGIDKKGLDRHRNKENADNAAQETYEKDKKRYDRAVEDGKKPSHEPKLMPKSYFDGVNADFIMRKVLDVMSKDKFDNRLCKWYSKASGETKCQITFNKGLGKTTKRGFEERVPTATVTATYSKENGFHCYPDARRGEVDGDTGRNAENG